MTTFSNFLLFLSLLILIELSAASEWIEYGQNGTATMTHYGIGQGTIAACGCSGNSSDTYPTAAMSQMAYGSSTAFGLSPTCGRCFNLTLLNTWTGTPPFYPNVTNSVVVKVTDLCPLTPGGWCDATPSSPNPGGQYINFDLAYPSLAIPDDFYPSDVALYGYTDFGVWNISFEVVDCSNWAGWSDPTALGTVTGLGNESVCCPANPNSSDFCTSYSDDNGIPAEKTAPTSSGDTSSLWIPEIYSHVLLLLGLVLFTL